jgi:2-amino-4-hydroxy-6-hydroxymethyldihydropteridine diphosphokinase
LKTVYLGLGSNVGDRETNLREALKRLESEGTRVVRRSSLYET